MWKLKSYGLLEYLSFEMHWEQAMANFSVYFVAYTELLPLLVASGLMLIRHFDDLADTD